MTQQFINIGTAPNDGTGDPARTAFDKCNLNFTELYDRSSSVSGFAEYRWDTATTPPPGSGYIRANNASVAAATALYVHNITYNGSDIKRVLTEMLVGSALVIQDQDNNVNFAKFNVTGTPIDQTTYVEFPVACVNSGGVFFNNSKTLVAMVSSGGGGGGAPIDSPTFTGDPKAPTPSPGDNDTSIATTAFVTAADNAVKSQLIGSASSGMDTLGEIENYIIANINPALGNKADIFSPTFTGDPKAPTPTTADNDTSIATTAFVKAAIAAGGGSASVTVSATPPVSPAVGSLWWDTISGQLFIWYNDGTSSQWVVAISSPTGSGYLPGQLVQITRQDVSSAVASVDFTAGIDSTYDEYELHLHGVVFSAIGNFNLRISANGGASWKSDTAYMGQWSQSANPTTNAVFAAGTFNGALIGIGSNVVGNASFGTVKFVRPADTTMYKKFMNDVVCSSSAFFRFSGGHIYVTDTAAMNGVRLYNETGNITAGTFILYGVKK